MRRILPLCLLLAFSTVASAAEPKPLKLLFLGDNGHHKPADRHRDLAKALEKRQVELVYTDKADALTKLDGYDGLVVYANIDAITPAQEKGLLDFVASGKGFIPLHCASYCFRNSEKYVELVGAQFSRHGTGTFRVTPTIKDHPITRGYGGFESWDETYVHTKHNEKDRIVLEFRDEEPWTWVRKHGEGRVFYTAWGHDERTFGNPGFHNLVERGIRWACGDDPATVGNFRDQPEMIGPRKDVKPFEYVEAKLPFYPAGEKWGTVGEAINKMQKPLPPEESVKHYQHPADFEMKLFASEPHFGGKPICINWDERGRLWACVTVDYPNEMKREGEGRDKIVVVEDTDGDLVGDKYTIFADKLSIPTSMAFAYGGIVVTQAPRTLFLRDTDGDGVADERKTLFSGWGTQDTHAGPSNLRYGPDGWYYGMSGYSGFRGTVNGEEVRFGQGFFRIKLEQDDKKVVTATKLEFLRGTNNNSWGVGFSEEGHLFGSTANGCPSVHLAIPNRYYEKVRGWSSKVLDSIADSNDFHPIVKDIRQVDHHGGFTSAAGHALYTARAYPKEYWNRTAFVSDPTGHLTATFVLTPDGTTFKAKYGWNLAAGAEEWIAPIAAEVGPDGCVWILDWYNVIVQHNPTPVGFKTGQGNAYESELRDKKHGRIYRMVPKGMKGSFASLKDATDDDLVVALKNDNMLVRLHAQRLILEGKKVGVLKDKDLFASFSGKVEGSGFDPAYLHVLWLMRAFAAESTPNSRAFLHESISHKSDPVRMTAANLLFGISPIGTENSVLLNDASLSVRLSALLGLSEATSSIEAGFYIAGMLRDPSNLSDRWLPDAITAAGATHHSGFLQTALGMKLSPKAREIVAIVAEHVGRSAPDGAAESIAQAMSKADPATAEVVLTALAKGWRKGAAVKLSAESETALVESFPTLTNTGKGQLIKLATAWGTTAFDKYTAEIAEALTKTLGDLAASDADRAAAARQLVEFKPADGKTAEQVLDAITLRTSPVLVAGLVDAAGISTSPELGGAIVKRYGEWSPNTRAAALKVMLVRPDTIRVFLDAVEKGTISIDELALDQKQALAAHPDSAINKRAKAILAKGGGLPNADRQKVVDELLPLTKQTGDAVAGKLMFTKHCAACHKHNGEGTKIGPDLTGMAVHPKLELLVHIMDPSRSVEGNFRLYQVATNDEKVISGMLASETKTAIELIDAKAVKHVILRENIDSLKASSKSLMPEGFEKQMNAKETTDLLEFLTKRGKYLPIPLDKAATIVSTQGMFFKKENKGETMAFSDWKPKMLGDIPFVLVDPQGDKLPNFIMLQSPAGDVAKTLPKTATLTVNSSAKAIHLLGGVGGWAFPYSEKGSVSLIVRLKYEDGTSEDHNLVNGEHIADYIRKVDVPGSKHAFGLGGKQMRHLTVMPKKDATIKTIEFVKGGDVVAPIIAAVTIEGK